MAFPTGWNRRAPLVIQSSLVSALLSDFPLLLTKDTLPSEMLDADGTYPAQNGGGDLRFSSDEAGATQLACEVVTFTTNNDPALGSAEIWVKVPSVSASVNTTIYVWYNTAGTDSQPAVTDTYGRNAVWSDYDVVAHLTEAANTTSGGYINSVGANHGTGVSMAESLRAGPFGADRASFDGTADYIDFDITAWTTSDNLITFQAWAKVDDLTIDQRVMSFWDHLNNDVRSALLVWMDTGGTGDSWAAQAKSTTAVTTVGEDGTDATTGWHKVAWVVRSASLQFFVDNNSPKESSAWSGQFAGLGNLGGTRLPGRARVGRAWDLTGTSAHHDGAITGVRLRKTDLSSDWIAAEYSNQNSPATFVIEGTPVSTATGPTITSIPAMTRGIQATITGTGFGT